MTSQTWATTADMAARYQISVDTVRDRVNADVDPWPCSRFGRLIRFSPEQQDEIARRVAVEQAPRRRASRIHAAFDALRAA